MALLCLLSSMIRLSEVLDSGHFDMVAFDVASAEIVDVRVAQASEALEEKHITHSTESLLGRWDFELSELVNFLPSEEDDFLLRILEFGLKRIVGIIAM